MLHECIGVNKHCYVFLQFRALLGAVLYTEGKEAAQQSVQGLFPIHIAAEKLYPDAIVYLLEWGVEARKTALHYAVRVRQLHKNKQQQQKALLQVLNAFKAGHDVEDARGHVPLFNAIVNEDIDLVKLLIAEAPIDHADVDGDTHLHIAADVNSEEIVRLLISKDANPMLCNHDGLTPAHVAAQKSLTCLAERQRQRQTN